jgi:hypothetical protein
MLAAKVGSIARRVDTENTEATHIGRKPREQLEDPRNLVDTYRR